MGDVALLAGAVGERLASGLERLGIVLSEASWHQMEQYISLLWRWRRTYNLMADCSVDEVVVKHLLDSVSIYRDIPLGRVLDVGTGAGFPGVPLSICCPDRHYVLLDGRGKKARFLGTVQRQLGLSHVEVVESRVERYRVPVGFDAIMARAVGSVSDIVQMTEHLMAPNGCWVLMKGQVEEEEWGSIQGAYTVRTKGVEVPYLGAVRHLVLITRK